MAGNCFQHLAHGFTARERLDSRPERSQNASFRRMSKLLILPRRQDCPAAPTGESSVFDDSKRLDAIEKWMKETTKVINAIEKNSIPRVLRKPNLTS